MTLIDRADLVLCYRAFLKTFYDCDNLKLEVVHLKFHRFKHNYLLLIKFSFEACSEEPIFILSFFISKTFFIFESYVLIMIDNN